MLAIVWHGRTGASCAMARAAHAGAGGAARLICAHEAEAEDLLAARTYLFIGPENLAAMTGTMKEMFDRLFYPLLGRIEGRGYATAIAAGSDGDGALAQIDRIVTGWRLRRVVPDLRVNLAAQTPEQILAEKRVPSASIDACADLGRTLAAGMEIGMF